MLFSFEGSDKFGWKLQDCGRADDGFILGEPNVGVYECHSQDSSSVPLQVIRETGQELTNLLQLSSTFHGLMNLTGAREWLP